MGKKFGLFVCFFFLFSINFCSASTIFTDNFDSYSDGNLNGQGGWISNSSDQFFTVESSTVQEGGKAIASVNSFQPFGISVHKSGSLVSTGRIQFYFKSDENAPYGLFRLTEGDLIKIQIKFFPGFVYYTTSSNENGELGVATSNTWHLVTIEWRDIDKKVRYNLDGGVFTPYISPMSPWESGVDGVTLYRDVGGPAQIYFDNIQENSALAKTPVLIVPGLTGTELKDNSELLWADVPRMVNPFNDDSFLNPLAFNVGLTSIDLISSGEVIRREPSLDYTDGLINEFKNQGYVEDKDLFTFPYDWRYGVSGKYLDGKTNIDLLAQKINDILTQTRADKINIVAHSMGGLIVKQYVMNYPTHHINKAIFVGVPNTGSPRAIKVLVQGDNLDIPGLNDLEVKKISQNMPAIYDLLPSQQYYDSKGSYVKVIDQGFTGLNTTSKDLNYSETKDFLVNEHSLNTLAVSNAEGLHTQSFDNFDLRTAGIDTYVIDGCKTGTLGKIIETQSRDLLGQEIISYRNPELTPGDGLVPFESSTNLPVDVSKKYYALKGNHSELMSHDGIRQEIVNIISNSNLPVDGGVVTQNIDDCKLNGKAISVYSPIDITVTDQDGNTLGLADDESIENTIPNADFEILDGHKFIYLPTDENQQYQIAMQGTGDGVYTITIDTINDNTSVETEVFSNLPVTTNLTGSITLGTDDVITVKPDSSSQPQTVLPSLPEALIFFNPARMDMVFEGTDKNIDTVIDSGDSITISDEAKNTTSILLNEKDRKTAMKASLKSIVYNGLAFDIGKNTMNFFWSLDKTQKLKSLTQQVTSKNNYTISANYDGVNTKIVGKDALGKIDKTIPGLVILKVNTVKGDLRWSY